jgi:hypothetical protein
MYVCMYVCMYHRCCHSDMYPCCIPNSNLTIHIKTSNSLKMHNTYAEAYVPCFDFENSIFVCIQRVNKKMSRLEKKIQRSKKMHIDIFLLKFALFFDILLLY